MATSRQTSRKSITPRKKSVPKAPRKSCGGLQRARAKTLPSRDSLVAEPEWTDAYLTRMISFCTPDESRNHLLAMASKPDTSLRDYFQDAFKDSHPLFQHTLADFTADEPGQPSLDDLSESAARNGNADNLLQALLRRAGLLSVKIEFDAPREPYGAFQLILKIVADCEQLIPYIPNPVDTAELSRRLKEMLQKVLDLLTEEELDLVDKIYFQIEDALKDTLGNSRLLDDIASFTVPQ
jgi:hypothetical protein